MDAEADTIRDELKRARKMLRETEAALVAICLRDGRIRLSARDVQNIQGKLWTLTSHKDDAGTVVIEAHEKPTTEN